MPMRDQGVEIGLTTGSRWSWEDVRRFWADAESMGFDSLWMSDHIMTEGYTTESGRPEPTSPDVPPPLTPMLECWSLLAGAASRTERVMTGTIVSPVTFRHPSILAKQALSLDQMTVGRFTLGLGAGYTEREHRAFGIPYPPPRERVEMLAEQLEIMRLLETEEHASFQGKHYRLEQAPCVPKPVNGHIPIMIGGTRPMMMRLAAQYADHYNVAGSPNYVAERFADLDAACDAAGRDPSGIKRSVGLFIAPVDPLSSLDRALHVIERFQAVGCQEIIFGVRHDHLPVIEQLAERMV
jgi:alkanesulfonate monooxygenase SsuD/methylene tetrahydromethanopterin reductase-like flavin-dependent oxidoreductase (luciferase family)